MPALVIATRHRGADLPQDSPMPLLSRRRVIGAQMMISEVTLQKGSDVPLHSHANEQMTCVLRGCLRFTFGEGDGRAMDVTAGQVSHLPSGVPHAALALEDTVVLDLFSPPSATTGIDGPAGASA